MRGLLIICSAFFVWSSCGRQEQKNSALYFEQDKFPLPAAVRISQENSLSLWATYYYLPQIKDKTGAFPLRDMQGNELGPRVSLLDWCGSALEGSVQVVGTRGELKTYNYAGESDSFPVDCSSFFSFNLSKTKFRLANGPFGDGVDKYILVPYRTLATDPQVVPPGTALYIPEARGAVIPLPNGSSIVHDGYFFAADAGGAIRQNHVDVFIGLHSEAPFFPWIGSSPKKIFSAYIVKDQKIIDLLAKMHLGQLPPHKEQ